MSTDTAERRQGGSRGARAEDETPRRKQEEKAMKAFGAAYVPRWMLYSLVTAVAVGVALLVGGYLMRYGYAPGQARWLGSAVSSLIPSMTVAGAADLTSDIILGVGVGVAISASIAIYQAATTPRALGPPRLGVPSSSRFPVPTFVREPLVDQLTVGVSEQMISAGFVVNPVVYVGKYVTYSIVAALISVPLSIILFYFTGEVLYVLINLVPLFVLAFPHIQVSSMLNTTSKGEDDELPYFALFASVMQSAGISLYNAFERIVGSGVFRWMGQEAQLIQKERMFFGKTEGEALQERSRHISSERFRVFVQGYTSVMSSGGDLAAYLQGKVKEFLQWSEFSWKKYASSSSDIGEVIVSVFFVLPLLIISMAFVFPEATTDIVGLMIVLVLPLLAAGSWIVIDRAQPKSDDKVTGDLRVSTGAAVAVAVVTFLLAEPYWVAVSLTLIAFTGLYGWSTYFQLRDVRQAESALPQFLRDVTEYKKIGYDTTKAIEKLAKERSYNPAFDFVLIDSARQLELGARLKEVTLKTRSWFVRMAFRTLGEIVESGGGTPELMELVTDFTQRISTVKKETKSSLRLYEGLTYFTPIGLVFVIVLMEYLMVQFSGTIETGSAFIYNFTLPSPIFLDLTKVMIVEASVMAAFVASKAVDFTSKATFRMTAVTIVSVLSIVLSEYALAIVGIG